MKNRIIIDLDGTLTIHREGEYENATPNELVISKLHIFKKLGYEIVIFSARNMRKYEGNIGLININTLPIIINWLKKNDVPYDEVIVGKPWCGNYGYYVDDRAVRPDEFAKLTPDQISGLVNKKHQ